MKKLAASILALALSLSAATAQIGLFSVIDSDITLNSNESGYDQISGVATLRGDCLIQYEGTEIRCDQAQYNTASGDILCEGNVSVIKDGNIFRGDAITYNIKSGELRASELRSGQAPLFYDTGGFSTSSKEIEVLTGEDALFTTHDSPTPNYHLKAKTIKIYPNDRVVFYRVTVYAGRTPVAWFPYYVQPLDAELGYSFTPGYSNLWGAFLLNRYGMLHGDHTLAQYQLDVRSERGLAGGVDLISQRHRENPNFGKLRLYYAQDADPTTNFPNNAARQEIDDSRYRVNFQHRIYFPGPAESTLYVDFDINKISDQFFYRDFFPGDARTDPNPDNIINLVKWHERGEASLLLRFQANDFYQTDVRSPELALDFARQQIGSTNIFYQGTTSFGILEEDPSSVESGRLQRQRNQLRGNLDEFPDDEETLSAIRSINRMLEGEEFSRLYSYHELLYPLSLNWLNVVPRAGVGGALYSSDQARNDDTRLFYHAGFDASFKLNKEYNDTMNRAIGLNGLRHVVQPYFNFSALGADDPQQGFVGVDRRATTTRPAPIDVPLYTAIDSLDQWVVGRVGVRNLWQTRRIPDAYSDDSSTFNWLGMNTFVDAFGEDPLYPDDQRTLSNLYHDTFWAPLPWLRLDLETQWPLDNSAGAFTEVNTRVTYMPTRSLQLGLGHLHLADHPVLPDSSLVSTSVYYRVNPNWGLSMNHRYELDDSVLESQSYVLHRDLTSWTASLGAVVRDNRGDDEFGVVFMLTLKDFPQVSIPLDLDPSAAGGNR
jgi:LPS-assembly protein